MTVAVSAVLSLGLGLLARLVARTWHEPSLAATLPIMAPAICGGNDAGADRRHHGREGRAHEPLRARPRRADTYCLAGGGAGVWLGGTLKSLAVAHVASAFVVAALAVAACARVFGGARLRQALGAGRHPGFLRFALPLGRPI